ALTNCNTHIRPLCFKRSHTFIRHLGLPKIKRFQLRQRFEISQGSVGNISTMKVEVGEFMEFHQLLYACICQGIVGKVKPGKRCQLPDRFQMLVFDLAMCKVQPCNLIFKWQKHLHIHISEFLTRKRKFDFNKITFWIDAFNNETLSKCSLNCRGVSRSDLLIWQAAIAGSKSQYTLKFGRNFFIEIQVCQLLTLGRLMTNPPPQDSHFISC